MTPELCLAFMLYSEARNQEPLAKVGVIQVAIFRSEKRNKHICEIIYEKGQFHVKESIDKDSIHFIECYILVENILKYNPPNVVNNAEYFTSNDIPPFKGAILVRRIHDMRFWVKP